MKTNTDLHWSRRAKSEADDRMVNIADLAQRQVETAFILKHLAANARILEVGCGNGYLTRELRKHAGFVDAFDYSEEMIDRAKRFAGETNNRFFHDSILNPTNVARRYDQIVCVRVLINLRDLTEQQYAIEHMHRLLVSGGQLILIEGFADGFTELNRLRSEIGMEHIIPAAINTYSELGDVYNVLKPLFQIDARMHTGMFDLLTRILLPLLVGAENANGPSEFHDKIIPLATAFNPDCMALFARLHGFVLRKL